MLGFRKRPDKTSDAFRRALDKSMAIVEFDPSGRLLAANDKFCTLFGYSREEILGKDHSMFVDPEEAQSREFRDFCERLARGECFTTESRRLGKGGKELWVVATYSPIVDSKGHVERILAVAADCTAEKLKSIEWEAKLKAVENSQAVVEYTPSGDVLNANENFLHAMGYALNEVKGRNHRMFVDPAHVGAPQHQEL